MKRKVLLLSGIGLLCLICLSFLYFNADIPNKYDNGFRRQFATVMVSPSNVIKNTNSSLYYAGMVKDQVILGDFKTREITVWRPDSQTFKKVEPALLKDSVFKGSIPRVMVDSPFAFLSSEPAGVIVQTNILMDSALKVFRPGSFSGFVPLNGDSFITRKYDTVNKQNDIQLWAPGNPVNKKPPILQKQYDGFFCTDGMLRSGGQGQNHIVYAYYYRNQIVCLDTALNIWWEFRLIDTVSTGHIKMSDHTNWQSLASPPWIVNKDAFVYGNNVYIYSGLKADNESRKDFNHNAAIDVYKVSTGKYLFSFYIPRYESERLNRFAIVQGYMVGFYDSYVVSYRFGLASD